MYERWQTVTGIKEDNRSKKLANDRTETENLTAEKVHRLVQADLDQLASVSNLSTDEQSRLTALVTRELLPSAEGLARQGVEVLHFSDEDRGGSESS